MNITTRKTQKAILAFAGFTKAKKGWARPESFGGREVVRQEPSGKRVKFRHLGLEVRADERWKHLVMAILDMTNRKDDTLSPHSLRDLFPLDVASMSRPVDEQIARTTHFTHAVPTQEVLDALGVTTRLVKVAVHAKRRR